MRAPSFSSKAVSSLFLITVFTFLLSFLLVGCQKKEEAAAPRKESKKETVEVKKEEPLLVTKNNPLKIDEANKKVYVYAEVNGKYLYEPTRHGVVFKDGSNGNKSVFKAYADPLDFWEALTRIGAKPGNNVTKESPEGTLVEGDILDVKIRWKGASREYALEELIKSEPDKGFEIRFGGNKVRAEKFKTGCILCLDSCAVGITSNARWGWKSFDTGKVKFTGNPDLLKDGQPVVVIFTLK